MALSLRSLALPFVLASLVACADPGDTPATTGDAQYDTETAATTTPALERRWVLRSDGLTVGAETLGVTFDLPASYSYARLSVDDGEGVVVTRGDDGRFAWRAPVTGLATGDHAVVVRSKSGKRELGRATFTVSSPLYVVVSTDWDDTRMTDAFLARMEGLRQHHPGLVVSHFWAPYHYTDPEVSAARKDEIDAFVKEQRDGFGDEIGLHIHGWCHFVEWAGVSCKTKETFYEDDGSGYTTILAAYSQPELEAIFEGSAKMFAEHGFGRPTSFRAGGWTADAKVLRALAATGFTVDSSALADPAKRLLVWKGYPLYDWNVAHWTGITEASQPYFPLESDPTKPDPEKRLPLLEVPDNGALVDYITGYEMRQVYAANHPGGGALERSSLFQIGYHPPNFSSDFLARMDDALGEVDEHLYEKDLGPAVYVTISKLTAVWPR